MAAMPHHRSRNISRVVTIRMSTRLPPATLWPQLPRRWCSEPELSRASSDEGQMLLHHCSSLMIADTMRLSLGLSSPLTAAATRPKGINRRPSPATATTNLLRRSSSTDTRYDRYSVTPDIHGMMCSENQQLLTPHHALQQPHPQQHAPPQQHYSNYGHPPQPNYNGRPSTVKRNPLM